MKGQVLHTVWRYIFGEATGEIWNWSLLGVKGLKLNKETQLWEVFRNLLWARETELATA